MKKLSSISNKNPRLPGTAGKAGIKGHGSAAHRSDRVSGVCLRFSPNQYHGNIIDVRAGSAGDNQSLHCLQSVVGIVVLQSVKQVPARRIAMRLSLPPTQTGNT